MNWTRINWLVALWIAAAMIVSLIPERPTYGFLPLFNARVGVMVLFYSGLGKIARVLRQEVERYAPASATAAKQFNEQLKLTAATINGVAIAVVSIFVLTTMMKDSWPNPTWLLLSIGVALQFHVQARALLGMMKDESPPALPGVQ